MDFEKYLYDFSSSINLQDFILNFIIVTLLALLLKWFYTQYGRSASDRDGFANNFIILALATFLIITVIKSSIALSLGLVGALSIVRFRAAIKEPEELTYLFLIIGLGVVGGANKPLLALIFFPLILVIIWIVNKYSVNKKAIKNSSIIHLETSQIDTLSNISGPLSEHTTFLELRKQDVSTNSYKYSFVCRFENIEDIDNVTKALRKQDAEISISIIDQPLLIV